MDWARLNDKTFEELACAYAKDTYHEYQWVPTGKSWDGNKDALFRNKSIASITIIRAGVKRNTQKIRTAAFLNHTWIQRSFPEYWTER